MLIYLDSSALVKRSLDEPEREAVVAEFDRHVQNGDVMLSSSIAWVEVSRAIRLQHAESDPARVVEHVAEALALVNECVVTAQVTDLAARYGPASVRSLDALHLATAFMFDADVVWAYDRVLLRSAAELGFRTMSPGAA